MENASMACFHMISETMHKYKLANVPEIFYSFLLTTAAATL